MMGDGRCLRSFAKYASLNVLGMLGLSCYILADTFFISQGMGAAGLALPAAEGLSFLVSLWSTKKYDAF